MLPCIVLLGPSVVFPIAVGVIGGYRNLYAIVSPGCGSRRLDIARSNATCVQVVACPC